ncbi:MAG: acyl-CoA dehydrogenase [Candidatus Hydrogenedens sp.]|nr:acyl-CoA dehydrogenase [Candidatus Hydrogenedens sp.]
MDRLDYYALEPQLGPDECRARDRVRELVHSEIAPHLNTWWRAGEYLPDRLYPLLGEAGAFGAHLQGYGCPGLSYLAYCVVMRELEFCDSGLRSLASVQGPLGMYAIHAYGSEEQKQQWLPRLARGEAKVSFALTERLHGSDPAGMETVAVRKGDEYILNGNKCWIGNGSVADIRVVWAKNDEGRVEGFLVERDAPGLRAEDIPGKLSLCLSRTSELWFEDCRIPAANRLPGASGLRAPLGCLSEARLGISWGVIGAAQSCYHAALDYAKSREQFGQPIAGFQLVQEKLAWMVTEITKAQLVAWQLAALKASGAVRPQQISLAKRNNVWMALECARMARNILGGTGIIDAHPVFRHLVNLETVFTYEGTHDIHTLILGQDVTGISAFS